jgi:hypothetical protein
MQLAACDYVTEKRESLDAVLSLDLARMGECAARLSLTKHRAIVENIIFLGLNAMKDEVLASAAADPGKRLSMKERRARRRYLKP